MTDDDPLYEKKLTSLTYRKQFTAIMFKLVNRKSSIYLLDENTATVHFIMLFSKTNPLRFIFIKKIDQLIASGVISWSEERRNYVPKQVTDVDPQRLTMEHIGICFLAIMISLGLCCIVFIVECTIKSFVNWRLKHFRYIELYLFIFHLGKRRKALSNNLTQPEAQKEQKISNANH